MREWWSLSEIVAGCRGINAPQTKGEMFCFLVYYCSGHLKNMPPLQVVAMEALEDNFKGEMVHERAIPSQFLDILEALQSEESATIPLEAAVLLRAEIERDVRSSRAEARQLYLSKTKLTHSFPFLSANSDLRWFTPAWVNALAIPGVPATLGGIYKWIKTVPPELVHAGNTVEWSAFPATWRRVFSVRWTNAMEAIGHRYMEDDFPNQFFARLVKPAPVCSTISEARRVLIEHVRRRICDGEGRIAAIRAVVDEASEASLESELGKAAQAANAKGRGISERSLRRWISEGDL